MSRRHTRRLLQHGMRLVSVLACVTALGCGGGKKSTSSPGTGSGSGSSDPGVVAQTLVGWGRQAASGGRINVFLEVADHTGATRSFPLGAAAAPCEPIAVTSADAITALRCAPGGVGTEYRAVYRQDIIVLRRPVDPSDNPDDVELMFQEVLRVDVPVGSNVAASPG